MSCTARKLAKQLNRPLQCKEENLDNIATEFEEELAEIQRKYGYQELLELLFMSYEREQMVTVAYDDVWLHTRLQQLDFRGDSTVQEYMQHACSWLWKDEEMHSVFVRGVLFKLSWTKRFRFMVLRIMQTHVEGTVGGWAGAVKNNLSWKRGPIMRLLAEFLFCTGKIMGKVPKEVSLHMGEHPFSEFCRLQIEIENTATVGWSRALKVAKNLDDLPKEWLLAFQRISADEANHMRIFKIFEDAFDGNKLRHDWDSTRMGKELYEVSSYFVPVAHQSKFKQRDGEPLCCQPRLGRGGEVHVVTGAPGPEAAKATLCDVLHKVGLQKIVTQCAEREGVSIDGMCVAIKASFMLAYSKTDPSNYVEPVLVQSLVQQLRTLGCKRVVVLESSVLYSNFYQHRSVREVSDYIGLTQEGMDIEVVDVNDDQVHYDYPRGLGMTTISRIWKDAHCRIVIGKMVSHPMDMALLATQQHQGLSGNSQDYLFVERLANRQAVTMMILENFPAHLSLLDAYNSAADGLVGMIACKRPLQPLRIYAGEDALAVDAVATRHMGVDAMDTETLKAAYHWFGDPAGLVTVKGVDEPVHGWRGPLHNGYRAFCHLMAKPSWELGSGHGQLFTPPMDTKAFPPVESPPCCLSALRIVVRWLLGVPCW